MICVTETLNNNKQQQYQPKNITPLLTTSTSHTVLNRVEHQEEWVMMWLYQVWS